jgi:hypothetical protein
VELTEGSVQQNRIEDISARAQSERDPRVAEVERITEVVDVFERAPEPISERAIRPYELLPL